MRLFSPVFIPLATRAAYVHLTRSSSAIPSRIHEQSIVARCSVQKGGSALLPEATVELAQSSARGALSALTIGCGMFKRENVRGAHEKSNDVAGHLVLARRFCVFRNNQ